MSDENSMDQMSARAERLINALAGAIMATAEAAAEKVELAAEVARLRQRMAAIASVLEAIGVQKQALMEKAKAATGTLRALCYQQVEVLEAQEVAILQKMGVSHEVATQALEDATEPTYRRTGRRFVRNGSDS